MNVMGWTSVDGISVERISQIWDEEGVWLNAWRTLLGHQSSADFHLIKSSLIQNSSSFYFQK
jgi:hypothetical protein